MKLYVVGYLFALSSLLPCLFAGGTSLHSIDPNDIYRLCFRVTMYNVYETYRYADVWIPATYVKYDRDPPEDSNFPFLIICKERRKLFAKLVRATVKVIGESYTEVYSITIVRVYLKNGPIYSLSPAVGLNPQFWQLLPQATKETWLNSKGLKHSYFDCTVE